MNDQNYLHCLYVDENGNTSINISDLARKTHAIRTEYFNPKFKKVNWWETIFCGISIVKDMRDRLPERHRDLYSIKPDKSADFDSLILQMKQSIKDYFVRNWSSERKLCLHSAGYDSRIISGILTELRQERGDDWIGDIHFRCHQPEERMFIEIMKMQGWREDQYSVWANSPVDHYNIGNKQVLNGFCPVTHQMDFFSDISPDSKKTVLIMGFHGGEFFCYPALGKKQIKNIDYCPNTNVNRWLNQFTMEGEWVSMYAYEYKQLLAPYLDYEYLKIASLMPDKYLSTVTRKLDTVRQAILKTMSINTLAVEYGNHNYTWNISPATKQRMMGEYFQSKFYQDYKVGVNFDNIISDIAGHDGKVWAFSLLYDKIHG